MRLGKLAKLNKCGVRHQLLDQKFQLKVLHPVVQMNTSKWLERWGEGGGEGGKGNNTLKVILPYFYPIA